MSDASASKVYTIVINDVRYRRPLMNPYTPISSIKQEVQRAYEIDYDFNLTYKGAILEPGVSFTDYRIKSSEPLRISRTDATYTSAESKIRDELHNVTVMEDAWTDQYQRLASRHESLRDTRSMSNIHTNNHLLQRANSTTTTVEHFSNCTTSTDTDYFRRDSKVVSINNKMVTAYITSTATSESGAYLKAETIYNVSGDKSINVKVASLDKMYNIPTSTNATLQNLWQSIHDILRDDKPNTGAENIFPLLFNYRMHIFGDIRSENEVWKSFLQTRPSSTDEQNPHFFIYFLQTTEHEGMYAYQKEPREICARSHWWIPCTFPMIQDPIAQDMLLVGLYTLRQYFRQPPKDEAPQRLQLEVKFLILIQQYIFLPATMALVHLLQSRMFAFEKAVLCDALLQLLQEFCPEDIEQSMLGIFMPSLICWLLEECTNIDSEILPCITYDLSHCMTNEQRCYIDDPATKDSLNEDSNILCEQITIEKRNITHHIDLSLFIKHWKNSSQRTYGHYRDGNTYTIVKQISVQSHEGMKKATHSQLTELFDMMVSKYPMFTLKTRKDLRSGIHDHIVLLRDKRICIALRQEKRRETMKRDKFIYLFDPIALKDRVTDRELYDIQRDGSDIKPLPLLLQSWLRIWRFRRDSRLILTRPIDQITLVLLDVGNPMFHQPVEKSNQSTSMHNVNSMFNILIQNLESPLYEHAFGLIQFGSQIKIVCTITQDVDKFEQAVTKLDYRRQNSTRLYEAIQTGIDCISKYERENCQKTHKLNKLIICISNGVNNSGSINFKDFSFKARKSKIRIDLISFLADLHQLKTSQERIEYQHMKSLCQDTKGFMYQSSCLSSNEFVTIFEQEACLWLNERANNGPFTGKYPTRKQTNELQQEQ